MQTSDGHTALSLVLLKEEIFTSFPQKITMVSALLRAGASLDACFHQLPAEDLLRNPADDQDPDYLKLKSLIDGRRARSYVPHVMHFSSLVARGRATSTDAGLTEALGILGHGGLPRDCARVILEFYKW